MPSKALTTKQMGDAGEMLVAAEITLAGIPAFTVPEGWPGYDVIAQPTAGPPVRVSVKARTYAKSGNFIGYPEADVRKFDWLAIVILPGPGSDKRRIFIVPADVAHQRAYWVERRTGYGFRVHRLVNWPGYEPRAIGPDGRIVGGDGLADFENNFGLSEIPRTRPG